MVLFVVAWHVLVSYLVPIISFVLGTYYAAPHEYILVYRRAARKIYCAVLTRPIIVPLSVLVVNSEILGLAGL